jgi:hypothetical protein
MKNWRRDKFVAFAGNPNDVPLAFSTILTILYLLPLALKDKEIQEKLRMSTRVATRNETRRLTDINRIYTV